MTRADTKALAARLFGNGTSEDGGLPLPSSLARSLLEGLADADAPVVAGDLLPAATHAMTSQGRLLIAAYGGTEEEAIRKYVADMLSWLRERKLVQAGPNGTWTTGSDFRFGSSMLLRPASTKARRLTVTVHARQEREERAAADRQQMDVHYLIAHPNSVKHDVVAQLRESAQAVGRQYPILTDRSGRIIDGHHRDQADPNWEKRIARRADGALVETEAEALALIRDLDIRRPPLTAKTRADIDRILGELAGTNDIKRDRVEAELKRDDVENTYRSNHVIAEVVGVSDHFVGEVRDKLRSDRSIHAVKFAGGRGSRSGVHDLARCWCEEAEEARRQAGVTKAPPKVPPKNPAKPPPPIAEDYVEGALNALRCDVTQTQFGQEVGLADNSMVLSKAWGIAEERLRAEKEAAERERVAAEARAQAEREAAEAAEQERMRNGHLLTEWADREEAAVQVFREAPRVVLVDLMQRFRDLWDGAT